MKFKADYEKIARGIFDILVEWSNQGNESYLSALALGMLPAPLMELAEKAFVDRMVKHSVEYLELDHEYAVKIFNDTERDTIHKFNHGLSCALLKVAKENKILVV